VKIVKVISDNPGQYAGMPAYTDLGCSPKILEELINFIDAKAVVAQEIHFALYLFNNQKLNEALLRIANNGVTTTVTTLPLEGYDAQARGDIYSHETGERVAQNVTKKDIAEDLFGEIIKNSPQNFRLLFYPHIYIRSSRVRPFSRGKMPYSLHIKSAFIKVSKDLSYSVLTSSNLAIRDLRKHEIMLIVENDREETSEALSFFNGLEKQSIEASKYVDGIENGQSQRLQMELTTGHIFTAPFIDGSNERAEKLIKETIRSAKNRILICAQHIAGLKYGFNPNFRDNNLANGWEYYQGFLTDAIAMSRKNVEVSFLSQTFVDENGLSHGCRSPANKKDFKALAAALKNAGFNEYYVNSDLHSKFIVVDDIIIFTTFNYTPTQFLYLPDVHIDKFDNIPGYSYHGVHSEVGHAVIINSKSFADKFVQYFNVIKNHRSTYKHIWR
jgi:hypothetical protein